MALSRAAEHATFTPSGREALSELHHRLSSRARRRTFLLQGETLARMEIAELPTPLQMFVRDGEWVASLRRDDLLFASPRASWSTTVVRQIPPRFVARFAAQPGNRGALPSILFDARVGLRDWARRDTAPESIGSRGGLAQATCPPAERPGPARPAAGAGRTSPRKGWRSPNC